jgi:uncharacterized repeat protein (TIGR03803 family)
LLLQVLYSVRSERMLMEQLQTLTTLYPFHTDPGDGALPSGRLIADAAGNLYGTTYGGGGEKSYGTIFKLTLNPDGTYSD